MSRFWKSELKRTNKSRARGPLGPNERNDRAMGTMSGKYLLLIAVLVFAVTLAGAARAEEPAPAIASKSQVRAEAEEARKKAEAAITAAERALEAAQRANKPGIVQRAQQLIEQNRKKLAEAEAMLREAQTTPNTSVLPTPQGYDPTNDKILITILFERAKKEMEAALDDALSSMLSGNEEAEAAAWRRHKNAEVAFREVWSKKQQGEHPQLMADMQRLRRDPTLAKELDQVLQRLHQDELAALKAIETNQMAETYMKLELKRLKETGQFKDTADLLQKSKTDPQLRAALDQAVQLMKENVMHDQADVLRRSTEEITREVARLKQKLPVGP